MFTESKKNREKVKNSTSSGSFVHNDTIVHMLNCELPFGGVGRSGNGRWHGKSGFVSFSNPKSVFSSVATNPWPLTARFPPYTSGKQGLMTTLLKVGGVTYGSLGKVFFWIVMAGILGAAIYKYKMGSL